MQNTTIFEPALTNVLLHYYKYILYNLVRLELTSNDSVTDLSW